MQCTACPRLTREGHAFCTGCGTGVRCVTCKKPLPAGVRFCSGCGGKCVPSVFTETPRKSCNACQVSLPAFAQFCKKCGKPQEASSFSTQPTVVTIAFSSSSSSSPPPHASPAASLPITHSSPSTTSSILPNLLSVPSGQSRPSSRLVCCTECNFPLKPVWAKYCQKCGKPQNSKTVLQRLAKSKAEARAATRLGRADAKDEQTFLASLPQLRQIIADTKAKDKSNRRRPKRRSFSEISIENLELEKKELDQLLEAKKKRVNELTVLKRKDNRAFAPFLVEFAGLQNDIERTESAIAQKTSLIRRTKEAQEEKQAPLVQAQHWSSVLKEEYKKQHEVKEELEDLESRVGRLSHRQQHSPWMFNQLQQTLLVDLERQALQKRIQLNRLDAVMTEKKGQSESLKQELSKKEPRYEELKMKATKPWLMTKEDTEVMEELSIAIAEIKTRLKKMALDKTAKAEELAEMEARYEGKKINSVEKKEAMLLVKQLKQTLAEKKARQVALRDMFTIAPSKVDVGEMKSLEGQVAELQRQLSEVPQSFLFSSLTINETKEDCACTSCSAAIAASATFCSKCGSKQQERVVRKCKDCGVKLKSSSSFAYCPDCSQSPGLTRPKSSAVGIFSSAGQQHQQDDDEHEDEEQSQDIPPIVMDLGTYSLKAGFTLVDIPHLAIRSTVAVRQQPPKRRPSAELWDIDYSNFLFGAQLTDSAARVHEMFRVNGSVFEYTNWDDVELMWLYAMDRMQLDFSCIENPLLLTEPFYGSSKHKETMTEILFEKLGFPALQFQKAPVLAAYGYGDSTGLVVDIGEQGVQVVPVVDGYLMEHAMQKVAYMSGKKASAFLTDTVKVCDVQPTGLEITHLCREIKRKLAFVVESGEIYDEGRSDEDFIESCVLQYKDKSLDFQLDAQLLDVGELFFQPQAVLGDQDASLLSVPELITSVLQRCSFDVRSVLVSNILLSGGTTLLPGFVERLDSELKLRLPHMKHMIRLRADKQRQYAAWAGGAVLANLDSFQEQWLAKWEFSENGFRPSESE